MVDVKGTTTLQFSNPIAYEQARRYARDKVDVIFSPVHRMKNHILRIADRVFQEVMQTHFNCIGDNGIVELCVPGDVQVDFAVNVLWHGEELRDKAAEAAYEIVLIRVTSRKTAGLLALWASRLKAAVISRLSA
jgi:hypothetical protein